MSDKKSKSKAKGMVSKKDPPLAKKSKAKSKELVEEVSTDEIVSIKGILDNLLDAGLAKTRKNLGLSGSSFDPDEPRLHTGLLCLDVLIGGGIVSGGWYTLYGGEQSAKTTLAMTIMASLLKQKFAGRASYWDYEGSGSPEYISNILRSQKVNKSLSEVFGEMDPDTGEQITEPLVEYVSTNEGEKFFEYYNRIGRMLPDKVKLGKKYYYLFEHTRDNLKAFKGKYSVKYLTKHNKIRVRAEDGTMQAIALLDSYPAMLPARQNKDDGDNSLGLQARMFSDQIKRIKGLMRQKRITIFGVNQTRLQPMAMGNPEYEPGGQALKFFSDVRIRSSSRALSAVPGAFSPKKGAGAMTEEPSVQGEGTDEYRFIQLRVTKNKLGGFQNGDCWARIWARNAEGEGMGLDPVFDTWNFLRMLNWTSGNRKKNMKFTDNTPLHGAKGCGWQEFKTLVLGTKPEIKKVCAKIGVKPGDIRSWCKKQVENGKAARAYADILASKGKAIDSSDESEED